MDFQITGGTATEIAESVRDLLERSAFRPDDALPPVRALAEELGVNRNTVMAAYRQLATAGLVVSRGRAGTRVADRSRVAQEGFSGTGSLRDVGTGNPDPRFIPDPSAALTSMAGRPVLYGEPVIDTGLATWAEEWMRADLGDRPGRLTITSGAVDAVERLLAQALTRDDAVALEDPCFLASIQTVRLGGYRAIPVPVDEEGMTVEGIRAALDQGVRAVVCTPRAQNPTGASLTPARAEQLRAVLAEHPYVLVIEDDHFSLLSRDTYHSIVGPDHRRWALVRSVSKFLGPDMCLALVASDPHTAERLALRLSPGTTWVSHLLQRLVHALVVDPGARARIASASAHYEQRNGEFARRLADRGITCGGTDGLNLWVRLPQSAGTVAEGLRARGWLVRTGDEFALRDAAASHHLRLTVHDLADPDAERLADDLGRLASVGSHRVG
ncbi:MAG TPA: transcriptional regulator PtsJ [Microbacterium sp.]|nr:transcriptional regulator PtsJ [Microbacterium sp.]